MASNFITAFHCPNPHSSSSSSYSNLQQNKSIFLKFHSRCSSSSRKFAVSEGAEGRVQDEELLISSSSGASSSARTQLDLLEQLSSGSQLVDGYESDGSYQKTTIRDQLTQLFRDRDDDFSVPLGKNLKKVSAKFLTISQKRNIKRQEYLNEVSQRNDSVFFATVGAFVILPPIVILGTKHNAEAKPLLKAAYLVAMDFTRDLQSFCSNEVKGKSWTMSEERRGAIKGCDQ